MGISYHKITSQLSTFKVFSRSKLSCPRGWKYISSLRSHKTQLGRISAELIRPKSRGWSDVKGRFLTSRIARIHKASKTVSLIVFYSRTSYNNEQPTNISSSIFLDVMSSWNITRDYLLGIMFQIFVIQRVSVFFLHILAIKYQIKLLKKDFLFDNHDKCL